MFAGIRLASHAQAQVRRTDMRWNGNEESDSVEAVLFADTNKPPPRAPPLGPFLPRQRIHKGSPGLVASWNAVGSEIGCRDHCML